MKRALRILILGPLMAMFCLLILLVLPVAMFFDWLLDEEVPNQWTDYKDFVREVFSETFR